MSALDDAATIRALLAPVVEHPEGWNQSVRNDAARTLALLTTEAPAGPTTEVQLNDLRAVLVDLGRQQKGMRTAAVGAWHRLELAAGGPS